MATLTLRTTKGSPLTFAEIDDNFTNLNTDIASVDSDFVNSIVESSNTTLDAGSGGNDF